MWDFVCMKYIGSDKSPDCPNLAATEQVKSLPHINENVCLRDREFLQ